MGTMAKLNNHITQMVVAGNDITTLFTGIVAWLPRRSRGKPGHREHEEPLAVSIPSHHWMEICSSLGSRCRSDVLVLNWKRGKHAALDITVTSPLIPSILTAASLMSEGAAAEEAEARKHRANDPKCSELGWVCIPLAEETYKNWGREAQSTFSSHLAIITSSHKKICISPHIQVRCSHSYSLHPGS